MRRGITELESGTGPLPGKRIRAEGGGRKRSEQTNPGLVNALMALVEPDEAVAGFLAPGAVLS